MKKTFFIKQSKIEIQKKVNQLLPLPFLRLSRNMNVYFKGISFIIWEHLQIFICIVYI